MRSDAKQLWNSRKQQQTTLALDAAGLAKMRSVAAARYAMVYESDPRPTDFTCKQGEREGEGAKDLRLSLPRERRALFGSVTRSHYASEHFLTRYPALIICLASAPETYGFIAKYARATKRRPPRGKNLISTSCSVLRRAPSFAGPMAAFEKEHAAASAVRLRPP